MHFDREDLVPPSRWSPNAFFIAPLGKDAKGKREREAIFRAAADSCAEFGIRCWRDIDYKSSRAFIQTITEAIRWATLVIVDLTDSRPNCYYELGLADAWERPVVLLCKIGHEAHADIGGRQIFYYSDAAELRSLLPRWVMQSALVHDKPVTDEDSCRGHFGRAAFSNGYLLTAYVEPNDDDDAETWYWLTAEVRATVPDRMPKSVYFHGDSTFQWKKPRRVQVKRGVAKMQIAIFGAVCIGATLVSPERSHVELELDLSFVPGSDPVFRSK